MTSHTAGSPTSRPGAHPSDINEVAHYLGAAVNNAMAKFAYDHQALARRLHWPVEMVDKNPAHAREMVRLDLARHAVVQHITGQGVRPAPRPLAHKNPPNVLDRLQSAALQELDREAFMVTHPIQALANHIHDQRIRHGGERHLSRANDLVGGGVAGAIADFGEGLGKAADLQRRYVQGGVVADAVGKRFFGLPAQPSAADQAAKMVAPLRREANLRPPRTSAGRLAAAAPRMAGVALAPGVAGPLILGMQSLGAANARARETHAPDTPRNDAGIAATAGLDTLVGLLLKGRSGLDPARVIERLPEAARSDALDLSAKVFAKSAAGASIGGAQTTADNLIAGSSYDQSRRWNDGLAEGATLGAATAPFGGIGHNSGARGRSPPSNSPHRSFTHYEILSEHPVSGSSRPWHRTQANRSFRSELELDGDFAAAMNDVFGAHVSNHMNSGFSGALINPPGAVWHHPVDRTGVVQLLRKTEHTDPRLQHILHPGPRRGGGIAQYRSAKPGAIQVDSDRRDSGR